MGVLIIRILLFRVLHWGPLFSETPHKYTETSEYKQSEKQTDNRQKGGRIYSRGPRERVCEYLPVGTDPQGPLSSIVSTQLPAIFKSPHYFRCLDTFSLTVLGCRSLKIPLNPKPQNPKPWLAEGLLRNPESNTKRPKTLLGHLHPKPSHPYLLPKI